MNAVESSAPADSARTSGFAAGTPRKVLRLENAAVLVVACLAYASLSGRWGLFALLFLTPDLSLLGYLVNRKVGAIAYNTGHSYLGPALLGAVGMFEHAPGVLALACIWVAHIGLDRLLGYGLKYASGFGHTHLGLIGRARRAVAVGAH